MVEAGVGLSSRTRRAFEFRDEFFVIAQCLGTLRDSHATDAERDDTRQKEEKADSPPHYLESA
jgi:hypothetical protein